MGPAIRLHCATYLAMSLLLGTGCANVSGVDPYGLFDTYTHVDGLYSFRYLSPPWGVVESETGDDRQLFAIEPGDGIDAQIEEGAVNARVKMVVAIDRTTSDAESEARQQLSEWAKSAKSTTTVQTFYSAQGAPGAAIGAVFLERYIRAVFQPLDESGAVVSMQLVSRERLDNEDMTLVLKSLEPLVDGD
jgi:hypothetical protein